MLVECAPEDERERAYALGVHGHTAPGRSAQRQRFVRARSMTSSVRPFKTAFTK
jgi:hypothetical protein